jgi:hypothetical protein
MKILYTHYSDSPLFSICELQRYELLIMEYTHPATELLTTQFLLTGGVPKTLAAELASRSYPRATCTASQL